MNFGTLSQQQACESAPSRNIRHYSRTISMAHGE